MSNTLSDILRRFLDGDDDALFQIFKMLGVNGRSRVCHIDIPEQAKRHIC
ncbi:MAG: hypothetical protein ACI4LM_03625 [Anaerovoracaceae bacterium]